MSNYYSTYSKNDQREGGGGVSRYEQSQGSEGSNWRRRDHSNRNSHESQSYPDQSWNSNSQSRGNGNHYYNSSARGNYEAYGQPWKPRSQGQQQQQRRRRAEEGEEGNSIWSTGEYRPLPPQRGVSRSPSPPTYIPSPQTQSSGYTTPERRQKLHQRTSPLPTPSQAYLSACQSSSSTTTTTTERRESSDEPILLILDLNHTLLCRSERNRQGSKVPLVRPYLSSFLEYITTAVTIDNKRKKFSPIIFSSARYRNVLSLLVALNLVPLNRLPRQQPYDFRQPRSSEKQEEEVYVCRGVEEGDVLELVWTRENMGLNERDFRGDVETTKDLEGVWKALKLGEQQQHEEEEEEEGIKEKRRNLKGARKSILIDDEVSKACQQPFNLLPIKPFIVPRKDFPPLPQFNPKFPQDLPPPPCAVELNKLDLDHHPLWQDKSLLMVIYQLEMISSNNSNDTGNIAFKISKGGFEKIKQNVEKELLNNRRRGGEEVIISEREVEEEMERRGEILCRDAGVEVRKEWDGQWRERVLDKLNRRRSQSSTC